MCKKNYMQVKPCLNRLIVYFYNYNFQMCIIQYETVKYIK